MRLSSTKWSVQPDIDQMREDKDSYEDSYAIYGVTIPAKGTIASDTTDTMISPDENVEATAILTLRPLRGGGSQQAYFTLHRDNDPSATILTFLHPPPRGERLAAFDKDLAPTSLKTISSPL